MLFAAGDGSGNGPQACQTIMKQHKNNRHNERSQEIEHTRRTENFAKAPIKEHLRWIGGAGSYSGSAIGGELVFVRVPDRGTVVWLGEALCLIIISVAVFFTGGVGFVRVRSTWDDLLFVLCEQGEAKLFARSMAGRFESLESSTDLGRHAAPRVTFVYFSKASLDVQFGARLSCRHRFACVTGS